MKLNKKQVNLLKAEIEGGSLSGLYNRLEWDKPKTIRLSMEEKDTLESMYRNEFMNIELRALLKKHMKERLK